MMRTWIVAARNTEHESPWLLIDVHTSAEEARAAAVRHAEDRLHVLVGVFVLEAAVRSRIAVDTEPLK